MRAQAKPSHGPLEPGPAMVSVQCGEARERRKACALGAAFHHSPLGSGEGATAPKATAGRGETAKPDRVFRINAAMKKPPRHRLEGFQIGETTG